MIDETRAATIVRTSAAYRATDWLLTRLAAAWTTSRLVRVHGATVTEPGRFWSVAVITAAVIVLAASPLGTTPRPRAWVVPVLAATVAVIVLLVAPRRSV